MIITEPELRPSCPYSQFPGHQFDDFFPIASTTPVALIFKYILDLASHNGTTHGFLLYVQDIQDIRIGH